MNSVTRLGNLLEFGQLFKAFGKKSNKLLNIPCSMIDECYDSDVTFLRKTENLAKYTNSYQFAYFKTILLFNLTSVTRLGNLLEFGQLFKAFGNSKFAQISHILRQFLKRCQNPSFYSENIFGHFYTHLAIFIWSH